MGSQTLGRWVILKMLQRVEADEAWRRRNGKFVVGLNMEIDKQKVQNYSVRASLGVVAWLPERKPLEPDPDNAGAGKRCLQLHFLKCLRTASPIICISPRRSVIQ